MPKSKSTASLCTFALLQQPLKCASRMSSMPSILSWFTRRSQSSNCSTSCSAWHSSRKVYTVPAQSARRCSTARIMHARSLTPIAQVSVHLTLNQKQTAGIMTAVLRKDSCFRRLMLSCFGSDSSKVDAEHMALSHARQRKNALMYVGMCGALEQRCSSVATAHIDVHASLCMPRNSLGRKWSAAIAADRLLTSRACHFLSCARARPTGSEYTCVSALFLVRRGMPRTAGAPPLEEVPLCMPPGVCSERFGRPRDVERKTRNVSKNNLQFFFLKPLGTIFSVPLIF